MSTILTLIIICAIAGVAIWLISMIPAPVPSIVKALLILLVVVLALAKVLPMLGVPATW